MFGGIGLPELILIGIVAVLLFGERLPEVARSVGKGYRELRRNVSELKSSFNFDDTPSTSAESYDNEPSPFDPMDEVDEPTSPKLAPPDSSDK